DKICLTEHHHSFGSFSCFYLPRATWPKSLFADDKYLKHLRYLNVIIFAGFKKELHLSANLAEITRGRKHPQFNSCSHLWIHGKSKAAKRSSLIRSCHGIQRPVGKLDSNTSNS